MQPKFYADSDLMIDAAIVGASGYSGAELLRILNLHPGVTVRAVTGRQAAGKRVDELYPVFSGDVELTFDEVQDLRPGDIEVVFIALPSGEAMTIVPSLLDSGTRVVDLGGDFRLPAPGVYEEFYHHTHSAPGLLPEAVYGLPEIHESRIRDARLVANPGCYPTSVELALLPALVNRLIEPDGIVVNSLSGVSGAGRSASLEMSFAELNENVRAYKIGSHQHLPEITSVLERAAGFPVSVSFVPHLVPITRGIYTTIHADLRTSTTDEAVFQCFESFYHDAPFVRVRNSVPQIKDVVYTNYCDLYCTVEPRTQKLILVSVIDNLVKGAAGQAIQNMNIMFDLPQETGLKGKDHR